MSMLPPLPQSLRALDTAVVEALAALAGWRDAHPFPLPTPYLSVHPTAPPCALTTRPDQTGSAHAVLAQNKANIRLEQAAHDLHIAAQAHTHALATLPVIAAMPRSAQPTTTLYVRPGAEQMRVAMLPADPATTTLLQKGQPLDHHTIAYDHARLAAHWCALARMMPPFTNPHHSLPYLLVDT